MMKVCAWCNKVIPEESAPDNQITHGICEECSDKMMDDLNALRAHKRRDDENRD